MAELLTTDTDLQTVANAIRTKGGTSASLSYPTGFANAIAAIASDCTATAGDILPGKTAWVGNAKITGNMSGKAAATYNTSSSDQTIAANQYLSGAQTIKAVTTSNLSAGNIKNGVNIKVGDANSAGRIANVTGTFANDATITASDVLSGKVGYNGANKITGNIPSLGATTYNVSTSDQTISSGRYLSGTQTIRRVTTANISAGNIKKGVTIQVGDSASATRIANVTGTCPQFSMMGSSQVPFIFNRNHSFGGWYYNGDSSSQFASNYTVGYYSIIGYTSSESKSFVVPAKVSLTFYEGHNTNNSPTTLTLNTNTWYSLKGTSSSGSVFFDLYEGSTRKCGFWKLVSWTFV